MIDVGEGITVGQVANDVFGIPPLAALIWPVPKERSGVDRLLSILHVKPANQLNHLLTTLFMAYKCRMHSL